jgi:hypothetical protein
MRIAHGFKGKELKSMNIQNIIFANCLKSEVTRTVKTMLDNKEKHRAVDSIDTFIVSLDDSYDGRLFHVFSGEGLGFKDIDKVFLFFK